MIVSGSYYWVLFFSALGGVLSVCAAALYLILPEKIRNKSLDYLLSFAIGMLLGAGFLHLLPEAIGQAEGNTVHLMGTALVAILLFFVLEKGLIWRHHHHHHADKTFNLRDPVGAPSGDSTASVILAGDMVHNFLDGVVIAAAFSADPYLGVVTALAVIAHEIPQELGDFAILLGAGYSRKAALVANLLTSLAMIVGATIAWFTLVSLQMFIPYLLTFTAASFIYVAVSDLMPTLNQKVGMRETFAQLLLIGSGVWLNAHAFAH